MRHNPPTPLFSMDAKFPLYPYLTKMLSVATKYFAGAMMLFADVQVKQAK